MITFNTAKELYKYLQIETERYINSMGTNISKQHAINISYEDCYPAPSLEELIKASPIELHIHTDWLAKTILINADYHFLDHETMITFEDSIVEAVAKIIIEYYKQKEQE